MRPPGRRRRPPTAGPWPRSSRRRAGTSRPPSPPGSGGNSPSATTCWPAAAPSATARRSLARSALVTRGSSSGSTALETSTAYRAQVSRQSTRLRIDQRVCRLAWRVPGRACAPLGAGWVQAEGVPAMILPKVRDPRFVTIRRGGTLTDPDHHLLALWAALCAEHVLHLFESAHPEDPRPREAIEHARAWARGEVKMTQARAAGGHAMGAARDLRGAARHAAYAAG